jgi:hypothetical protein
MSLRNKHISYLPTVHTQWFILQFRVIKKYKAKSKCEVELYFLHVIVQYVCCILLLCWYTCNQSYIEQFFNLHISTLHSSKYTYKLYVYYRQTQHIVYKNDGNMSLRNKHISYLPTVHTQWFILQFRVIKT